MRRPALRLLAALAAIAVAAGVRGARAADWGEVLAGERDTVLFLGTRGELVRAPFHLAAAETLWAPPRGERLCRVLVSPDGRRIAWLSRAGGRAPTTLWVADALGVRRVAGFHSLIPADAGEAHFEAREPSVMDPVIHGARLLEPGAGALGASANALAFRGEDGAVLFGSREGLGLAPPDTGLAMLVSRALTLAIQPLDPAPVYWADVLRLGEPHWQDAAAPTAAFGREAAGAPTRPHGTLPVPFGSIVDREPGRARSVLTGHYLFYPTARGFRAFAAPGPVDGAPWAASPGTVWWSEGGRLRAVLANDPTPRSVLEDPRPIVWLAYDPGRRALLRAGGRRVTWRAEAGDEEGTLLTTAEEITAVLTAEGSGWRGCVAGDSLVLWRDDRDARAAVALAGATPERLIELSDGTLLVADHRPGGQTLRLLQVQLATGRLDPIDLPAIRGAMLAVSPGRGALLLYAPAAKPPVSLRVWRPSAPTWVEVGNPGIVGWEPIGSR